MQVASAFEVMGMVVGSQIVTYLNNDMQRRYLTLDLCGWLRVQVYLTEAPVVLVSR